MTSNSLPNPDSPGESESKPHPFPATRNSSEIEPSHPHLFGDIVDAYWADREERLGLDAESA